jgi:hypothetical protein
MNTPNAERIAALVSALRSGEFQQGQHVLRQGDAYCCLGVASDLYRREVGGGWQELGIPGNGAMPFQDATGRREVSFLTPDVVVWYGFDSNDVSLAGNPDGFGETPTAITLNDSGASFPDIADAFARTFLKEDAS